jgi:hypothetical protein
MWEEKKEAIDWWRRFSPSILGIYFCVIGIVISLFTIERSGGWSLLGVIYLLPAIFLLGTLAFITRLLFSKNTAALWLLEIVALVLLLMLWP